ncbi:Serine/threonine-protein kinase PrkC [Legionella massiliensis]|uniref:Serine/threonine-protein kinase PrkC n=1 Tax=Legionella massiliensis TaxID=1034943 RepID=A0A078KTY5_9GAMM|nr:protein kinase [Legionella massiliensis]CDZ76501.1 Serine/threonine-protein kinase PrkC [Legionella massiliensis]CEE12239.1 Serine/threonine-protein kinase PrkC [Legionella massiliensis]
MIKDYDFLCGNDFTWAKIALGNDAYHAIRVQAELARTIDFSDGLRKVDEIIIDRCPKLTQILWPENARNIKRLKIGNSSMLTSLDLSCLVNLEELSIINCKKLMKLEGLGEQIGSINIQGSKLDTLEPAACKKIKQLILTTSQSDFYINFANNDFLTRAIIAIEGGRDGKINCLFSQCKNLQTLQVKTDNTSAKVDTSGCEKLGKSKEKPEDIESYVRAYKKKALKLPENPDDTETVVQENGRLGKNRACLVKFQLLMDAPKKYYQNNYDNQVEENSKASIGVVNLAHLQSSRQEKLITEPQSAKNNLKREEDYYSTKELLSGKNPEKNSKNDLLHNSNSSHLPNYVQALEELELNDSNPNNFDFSETKQDLFLHKNNNKIKENNESVVNKLVRKAYNNYLFYVPRETRDKRFAHLAKNGLAKAKEDANSNINLKGSLGKTELAARLPISGLEENQNDLNSKDELSSPKDLGDIAKKKAEGRTLAGPLSLAPSVTEDKALIAQDVREGLAPAGDLNAVTKIKAKGEPLKRLPSLQANMPEPEALTALEIKEKSLKPGSLSSAEKIKAEGSPLAEFPPLADYEPDDSFLLPLNLIQPSKVKVEGNPLTEPPSLINHEIESQTLVSINENQGLNSSEILLPTAKTIVDSEDLSAKPLLHAVELEATSLLDLTVSKHLADLEAVENAIAEPEALVSEPLLSAYEGSDIHLQSLQLEEPVNEEPEFEFRIARALVDLKPKDQDSQFDDWTAYYLDEINQRYNFYEPTELLAVEKIKAEAEALEAELQLCSSEGQESDLAALAIKDELQPPYEAPEFEFHIVRALVDLKPEERDNQFDDWTAYYLDEINQRYNLYEPTELLAVEKIKAEAKALEAELRLSNYENEETFLAALAIKAELQPPYEEPEFEFHVARALVDLNLESGDFAYDYPSLANFGDWINDKPGNLPANLTAVGKTKIEADYLQAAPQLSDYETANSHLLAISIIEDFSKVPDNADESADLKQFVDSNLPNEVLNDEAGTWLEHILTEFKSTEDGSLLIEEEEEETGLYFEPDSFAELDEDESSDALDRIDKFEGLKQFLIDSDLLDDVLNDETGTLLEHILTRFNSSEDSSLLLEEELYKDLRHPEHSEGSLDIQEMSHYVRHEVALLEEPSDAPDSIDKFEALKQFLIDSDLLDDVLNDETGTLLEHLFDRFNSPKDSSLEPEEEYSTKPELEINLKNVDEENVGKLLQFFDSQEQLGIKAWQKGKIYSFEDGTEFTFKNDVFQRLRKEGREGVRYEAISNKAQIGEGAFGKIRRIKGTVALDAEHGAIRFKKQGKEGNRRVVKVQKHSEDFNALPQFLRGFEFAKRAAHLAIKDPTIVDNNWFSQTSYTVMDEIRGRELFDINSDDFDGIDFLSTQERIELTWALLVALKEQVSDQGFIHRDIKPENILVDLGPPISVKIIDYDLSIDTPDGALAGTEGFYAPEVETNAMSTSAKSDVYSMARVIALVWRVGFTTYYGGDDYSYTPSLYSIEETLEGLFSDIHDLSEDDQAIIRQTLVAMLELDPEQRFSIEEAIDSFAEVGRENRAALLYNEALDVMAAQLTELMETNQLSDLEEDAALNLLTASETVGYQFFDDELRISLEEFIIQSDEALEQAQLILAEHPFYLSFVDDLNQVQALLNPLKPELISASDSFRFFQPMGELDNDEPYLDISLKSGSDSI